jgi:hypothetical protein
VQVTGLEPVHTPVWQVSDCVQAFPSLHGVPFPAIGFEHVPLLGSHVPVVWHWSCAAQVTTVEPTQTPIWHLSFPVHAFPSSQADPFTAIGFEQAPLVASHVPGVWHWSWAAQVTGFPPTHTPVWQVSVRVQAFPSLHADPFATAGFVQAPVVGSHIPGAWH